MFFLQKADLLLSNFVNIIITLNFTTIEMPCNTVFEVKTPKRLCACGQGEMLYERRCSVFTCLTAAYCPFWLWFDCSWAAAHRCDKCGRVEPYEKV